MLLRLTLSAAAWLAAVLIAALLVELAVGGIRRPGLVTLVTLPILAPLLFVIWRRRPPRP